MIDVVMISNLGREDLVRQSIDSLYENATSHSAIGNFIAVLDNPGEITGGHTEQEKFITVLSHYQIGASRARNIGASSIPKYLRNDRLMFIDDDVYMCPGWDKSLGNWEKELIISGHNHPYNIPLAMYKMSGGTIHAAGVLSTVHMSMSWEAWDDVGFFTEPGGAGGSEDVDWCKRATDKGYGLAITHPHTVIHCGLTSSTGERIVGSELVELVNRDIEKVYGLQGKVVYR